MRMDAEEIHDLLDMELHEITLSSVCSEVSQSLNPHSINTISDTSNICYHNQEIHDISFTLDHDTDATHAGNDGTKEIGTIAEREITLHKFEKVLKIKRILIAVCYLMIFCMESIYFKYFTYWMICPLLLCLAWLSLLSFNISLYSYLHKQAPLRLLFISSLSMLNILTVISLIIIYSMNFGQMYHFNHSDDYSFKFILFFNIVFVFCSFCMDINIIHYRQHTIFTYKLIFSGCVNNETYQIENNNGLWIKKRYTFEHPSMHAHHKETELDSMESELDHTCCDIMRQTQPFGICQYANIILFVIGMLGSIIFTINGIQRMQPYIIEP